MLSNAQISELTGSIYECSLDPGNWDKTLARIAQLLNYERLILSLNDLRANRILIYRTVGWNKHWLDVRNEHAPEIHERLNTWLLVQPSLDRPFVASREISQQQFENAPYVQRCLRPLGIGDVMHCILMATPSHFSELVLTKQENDGPFTNEEIELGSLLLPHVRRAVTISNVLDARKIELATMSDALDALRSGVVLADERGKILQTNRMAKELLGRSDVIMGHRGFIAARSQRANTELKKAITVAVCRETTKGASGTSIRLTEAGRPPVIAHVMPMSGGDLSPTMQTKAVVSIFIDVPSGDPSDPSAFAIAFNLTPAETRVLHGLANGRTISDITKDMGIAVTTVRTHVRNIFLKTGVSRQSELVRLAVQAVPSVTFPSYSL